MNIIIKERVFHFIQPAHTSRGVYTERHSWFVFVIEGNRMGVGECAPLHDLSCDARPDYAEVLRRFCDDVERTGQIDYDALRDYPSMRFGLETALVRLRSSRLFNTAHTPGEVGIHINVLVWRGISVKFLDRL